MDNEFEDKKQKQKEFLKEQRKKAYQKAKEYKKSLKKKPLTEEQLRLKEEQKKKAKEFRQKQYAEHKEKLKAERLKSKVEKKSLQAKRKTIENSGIDLKLVKFDEASGTMVKQNKLPPVLRLVKNSD